MGQGTPDERRALWAALLTGGFMIAEAVGGVLSGSLALLADAGHMFADSAGLLLAWLAFRIARQPADRRRTYGFDRIEVLVAFGNGLALFALAAFLIFEAARRFFNPVEIAAGPMLAIALAGLAVNIGAFFILRGADRTNLNIRGALLHVLGDLLGSAGAIAAAVIILTTGWTPADPLLSILVSLLILRSAWKLIGDSGHILLEGTPADLDIPAIAADLPAAVPGVKSVHHVHAWSISQRRTMVTLHACLSDDAAGPEVVAQIKRRLRQRFRIDHATVEIEHETCADEANGAETDLARC